MRRPVAAAALAALACGCSTTRALAPLPPGHGAITASFGGPVVEYAGSPIPVPITSVGYVHGLDGRTNLHGALYPTQLALFGVVGLDLGASTQIVAPEGARPRVMLDLTAYAFFGDNVAGEPKGGLRVFPDLSAVASWRLADRHALYAGVDNFVQPFPVLRYYPSPLVGAELRAGPVGFQLESKWLAWFRDTDVGVPVWYAPGKQGAVSIQLGLNVYLGKEDP